MPKLFSRLNFNKIFWVLLYFFIFCLLVEHSFSYLDPDFGWHLKVGQSIARTRAVPDSNDYNFTYTGSWVDHEWLSNYSISVIQDNFGYFALTLVFAGLILGVLFLIPLEHKYSDSFFLTAFFLIFGVVAALPHFGVRIQEIGLLFFAALLRLFERYDRKRDWRVLWLVPPLMYAWACFHASFLIGFFLLGAWAIIRAVEIWLASRRPWPWLDLSDRFKKREVMRFSLAAALALAASFFTPYGIRLYSFLAGYQNSFYQSRIQEWLTQFSYPFQYPQLLYLACVFLAVILYLCYSLRAEERYFKIKIWPLFISLLFIFLAFKSRRHFPLMFVATFPFMIGVYRTVFRSSKSGAKPAGLPNWLKAYIAGCLLLTTISIIFRTDFIIKPFESYCLSYPCGAVSYLKEHRELDQKKIFNEYAWGGYLISQLPERKIFIDGRLPQVGYAGHTFLEEYFSFFNEGATRQKLDQYGIGLVLLTESDRKISIRPWEKLIFSISDKDFQGDNKLRSYLAGSSDWRAIYRDETSVLYARQDK